MAELEFIISIIQLLLRYGIPGVIKIMKAWDVTEPTLEDIRKLRELVPPPEEYFKK